MRAFALYTLARLAIFSAVFGLLWLVFSHWIDWTSTTALGTAFIALMISSVIALVALRRLRERLAAEVAARAGRVRAAYEAKKRAEDDDRTS